MKLYYTRNESKTEKTGHLLFYNLPRVLIIYFDTDN